MGILCARARLGVTVLMGVCAGVRRRGVPYYWKCKIAVLFARGFVLFLEIIVFCVEGVLRNLWKKFTEE